MLQNCNYPDCQTSAGCSGICSQQTVWQRENDLGQLIETIDARMQAKSQCTISAAEWMKISLALCRKLHDGGGAGQSTLAVELRPTPPASGRGQPSPDFAQAREMTDSAFEEYRREKFSAYGGYPIDAYTYFCAGYAAAIRAMQPPKGE